MKEKQIEAKLVQAVKAKGGLCLKFTSPSMAGVPDRLVLLPEGRIGFVEVKVKGKNPRPLQARRMKQLSDLGFCCLVLDDVNDITHIIDEIGGGDG